MAYIKNAGTINYNLFLNYSSALVLWMKTFDPLYRKMSTEQKFTVMYANPERVFSGLNLKGILSNERINNPVMAVQLKTFKPEPTFNIPRLNFYQKNYLPNGRLDVINSEHWKKMSTYNLQFGCTLFVEFKNDADFILYSIHRELDNGNTKWLCAYGTGGSNKERFQYMPFRLDSVSDASQYEVGDQKDLKLMQELTFTVPWGYLPYNWTNYDIKNVINEVNITVEQQINNTTVDSEEVNIK